MKEVKTLIRLISVVVLLVFMMVNCSFVVFASDDQDNDSFNLSRYSEAELQEQNQINQKIVSSDFLALMYEHVSAGFAPESSVDMLLDSVYGSAFKIPNYSVDQGIDTNTDIWYVPVIYCEKMILLNRFFFVDGELLYTISSGYTDIFNENPSDSVRWVFDEEGELRACAVTDSLYESLPELDPFEENGVIDSTIDDLIGSNTRGVITTSTHVYLSSYPTRHQPASNKCWAASIASMVAYEYPSTYGNITPNDVCNAINVNGGATNSQCLLALCYYFHAPTYNPVFLSYCLSFAAMDNVIGHDDPIFVVGKNSDNTLRHAVALMGYWKSGTQRAMNYMNPNTAQIESGFYYLSAPLYFISSNVVYKWTGTGRIRDMQ